MTDFPDYRDDPLQGPQMGGEPPIGRAAHKRRFEALPRRGIEPRFATSAASPAQPRRPVLPPRLVPPAGGLAGHPQLVDDVGLTLAARKQLAGALSSSFQGGKVTTGAKGGRHGRIVAHSSRYVTIL